MLFSWLTSSPGLWGLWAAPLLAPSKELWETPLLAFSIAPAGSIGHSFLFQVGGCSGAAALSGAVYGSLRVSNPALRFSLSR